MTKRQTDRRVPRTKASLERALLSLIDDKDYESITVDDICETANVGRSTFYAHYRGKDDLKRSGLEHLRVMLVDRQRGALTMKGDSSAPSFAFSLPLFEHARDHMHLYRALGLGRGRAVALGSIKEMLRELVRNELAATFVGEPPDAPPRELTVEYVVAACLGVLTWWLDGGAKLPAKQVDAMFRRLAVEGVPAGCR